MSMRTSMSQFDYMVKFMKRNGDLSKPMPNEPHGRIRTNKKWEELITTLNLDATGTTKTIDKWRKVWSDLKNNTKRKAARIAASSNGGPPSTLGLSILEQEVLNIAECKGGQHPLNRKEVDVELEIIDQSVDSNLSAESLTSDRYETDQIETNQIEIVEIGSDQHATIQHQIIPHVSDRLETVGPETVPHKTVHVEVINEFKTEKLASDGPPEIVSETVSSVINESNKLFAKIIEQELVLVPKRRRIECMQEILGVLKKYNM